MATWGRRHMGVTRCGKHSVPAAVQALEKTGKHKNIVCFCCRCPIKALNNCRFFAPVMDVIVFGWLLVAQHFLSPGTENKRSSF